MNLVWTRPAHADRKKIREYIAKHAPAAALVLDRLFSEKAALLTNHPGLGRTGRASGTRELIAHRNYILIYDAAGDTVRILRLLHAAQQWPSHYATGEPLAGPDYFQPPSAETREWVDTPPNDHTHWAPRSTSDREK